jgi:hypothetical protein
MISITNGRDFWGSTASSATTFGYTTYDTYWEASTLGRVRDDLYSWDTIYFGEA